MLMLIFSSKLMICADYTKDPEGIRVKLKKQRIEREPMI